MNTSRTPWAITWSVWKALFLREAVFRLSTGRAGWLWLLFQPAFIIVVFVFIVSLEMGITTIGGMNPIIWIFAGQGGFYMFQQTAIQTSHSIEANKPLFAYRQVKPVDSVLVRAALEGVLMTVVMIILGIGIGLYGINTFPDDPLLVLEALFGLWVLGLGYGLIVSALNEVLPEVGKISGMAILPLHVLSGVMLNIVDVPQPYYDILISNPLLHCLQAIRLGFSSQYQVIPEYSLAYIFSCGLVFVFFGLVLHRRFASRMVTE